jgi:SAM-dependent methyltransferase
VKERPLIKYFTHDQILRCRHPDERAASEYRSPGVYSGWVTQLWVQQPLSAPEGDKLASMSPMPDSWLSDTHSSYDTDASGYVEKVRGLLGERPYLRASLALFAELVHGVGGGPVADVGCGPGYVTGHLHELGVEAFGIDISPEMIAIARRDYPDLRFEVGTMTDLELADDSVAGVLAFWSVIHVPDHAMPGVFEEFRRVLRPRGPLLVGFHVGDETRHTSEGYTGRPINVDSHHRPPSKIAGWLRAAGFTIEAELVTEPDEDVPGAVIFARSPT